MSPPGLPPPDLEGSGLPWTSPATLYAERKHKSATCRRYAVEIPPRIQQKTLQQGSRSGKYHFNSARAEPAELFLQTWAPNKGKSFVCRISGGGRVCSAADRREQKQKLCSMLLCKAGLGPPQRRLGDHPQVTMVTERLMVSGTAQGIHGVACGPDLLPLGGTHSLVWYEPA